MSERAAPLRGRRIVVTRRPRQAGALTNLLESRGATVIEIPAIEVSPPLDAGPLDQALRVLARYEWLVFTSPNAVEAVRTRLDILGAASLPSALKVASVGRATTTAIRAAFPGVPVRLEPVDDYRAEGLLEAFADLEPRPRLVLVPSSDRARTELAEGLRGLGAVVDNPIAYITLQPKDLGPRLEEALRVGVDLFLLASPSAVQSLALTLGSRVAGLPVAVIGPTTADAARDAGMRVLGVAAPSTVDGLVESAVRALGGARKTGPAQG